MFRPRATIKVFREFFEDEAGPSCNLVSYRHLPIDDAQVYFVINGKEGTSFEGGFYFGRLLFCVEHGLEQVFFYTPNGRFPINRDILRDLTSMGVDLTSPGSCSRMLRDLLYSSLEENCNCETTEELKRELAESTKAFNDSTFLELFPELAKQWEEEGISSATDDQMMERERILRRNMNCQVHGSLTCFEIDHDYLGRTGVMERILSEKMEQ
ncbi:hypothetical protein PFISCL1PPCAC_10972, partial [Pristionchus fissidentatus]